MYKLSKKNKKTTYYKEQLKENNYILNILNIVSNDIKKTSDKKSIDDYMKYTNDKSI